MKKKMFYGFTFFVLLTMIAVWQVAAAELAQLQEEQKSLPEKPQTEVAEYS